MERLQRKNFFEPIPENAVLVARPSRYGSPFKIGKDGTRQEVLAKYEKWLDQKLIEYPNFLEPLGGKNLIRYCPLSLTCHADIILRKLERRY
jgi:hypothetical protein